MQQREKGPQALAAGMCQYVSDKGKMLSGDAAELAGGPVGSDRAVNGLAVSDLAESDDLAHFAANSRISNRQQ